MQTLESMRFPLALAIIATHIHPQVQAPCHGAFSVLSAEGIYNIFWILVSHVLPSLAVPAFFVLSGFLFFRDMQQWDGRMYKEKLKRRLHTLLMPFIAWNLIMLLATLLFNYAASMYKGGGFDTSCIRWERLPHILTDYTIYTDSRTDWWGKPILCAAPFCGALWFVRDLIFLSILSPIIGWIAKRFPWGIVLFAALYVIGTNLPTLWLTPQGIFFFSIGSLFAIKEWDFVEVARKYRWGIIALTIAIVVPSVYFDADYTSTGSRIYPFLTAFGALCAFALPWPKEEKLSKTSFFVYSAHTIYILFFASAIAQKMFTNSTPTILTLRYLTTFSLTATSCVLLFYTIKKISPRLLSILTGGRI